MISPDDTRLVNQGRFVYTRNCVFCHGRTGKGNGPWAEGVDVKPRNFRTGIFKFRSTPCGALPTDADLRRTIRTGVSGTMMPTFAKLPAAELDAVIAYIKSLSPRWDDPGCRADPVELPDPPEWLDDDRAAGAHAAEGAELFAATCATCHGESGRGDGPGAAELIDVWEHPIVPADLTRGRYKSGGSPTDLYRTIATGLDGTPMVGFAAAFEPAQIWNLVAFIRSIESGEPEASDDGG